MLKVVKVAQKLLSNLWPSPAEETSFISRPVTGKLDRRSSKIPMTEKKEIYELRGRVDTKDAIT